MLEGGTVLAGRYRVLGKIAQGGMSTIYLAVNDKAGKEWVIKEVRREGVEDDRIYRRSLLMEIALLKELSHPHLPEIIDVLEEADRLLIVMEYIRGKTLQQILKMQGALRQEEGTAIGIQLCETLEYLHSRIPPIIYRDMKPSNIMVGEDGRIVLIDFGIARRYDGSKRADTLPLGTRGYAAPEQFLDESQAQSDARTDLYNLGATLYHALTGHNPCLPPYQMQPIRSWNKALSSGLELIITKATQADPTARFSSAAEFKEALHHYQRLDREQSQKDKRKLYLFALVFTLWIFWGGVALAGYYGLGREQQRTYYRILTQAGLKASSLLAADENGEAVISLYKKAIEINPGNPEAYLQLLDFYLQLGQTHTAVRTLSSLIRLYDKELKDRDELVRRLAFLCFDGSPRDRDFQPDYVRAGYFFGWLDDEQYPEASSYEAISRALSALDIQWQEIAKHLETAANLTLGRPDKDIDSYLLLANLITGNGKVLSEYMEHPLKTAIGYLNQAREELEHPYYDEGMKQRYERVIYEKLAAANYRQGSLEGPDGAAFFESSLYYYGLLIKEYAAGAEHLELLYRLAAVYRALERYQDAAGTYELIIREYPQDARAYAEYGAMVLINQGLLDQAAAIYEQGKMACPLEQHHHFIPLKGRLRLEGWYLGGEEE